MKCWDSFNVLYSLIVEPETFFLLSVWIFWEPLINGSRKWDNHKWPLTGNRIEIYKQHEQINPNIQRHTTIHYFHDGNAWTTPRQVMIKRFCDWKHQNTYGYKGMESGEQLKCEYSKAIFCSKLFPRHSTRVLPTDSYNPAIITHLPLLNVTKERVTYDASEVKTIAISDKAQPRN